MTTALRVVWCMKSQSMRTVTGMRRSMPRDTKRGLVSATAGIVEKLPTVASAAFRKMDRKPSVVRTSRSLCCSKPAASQIGTTGQSSTALQRPISPSIAHRQPASSATPLARRLNSSEYSAEKQGLMKTSTNSHGRVPPRWPLVGSFWPKLMRMTPNMQASTERACFHGGAFQVQMLVKSSTKTVSKRLAAVTSGTQTDLREMAHAKLGSRKTAARVVHRPSACQGLQPCRSSSLRQSREGEAEHSRRHCNSRPRGSPRVRQVWFHQIVMLGLSTFPWL
mmetsp:Transcript_53304/g.159006  ORF Transcript_53304/g.159006 Transcript_53304/m.159006 type:complete len:279 (+) Transcript_53304:127-963(+)